MELGVQGTVVFTVLELVTLAITFQESVHLDVKKAIFGINAKHNVQTDHSDKIVASAAASIAAVQAIPVTMWMVHVMRDAMRDTMAQSVMKVSVTKKSNVAVWRENHGVLKKLSGVAYWH
ncbi:hypothetical protein ElyMa_005021600 [Elysia marginata]|uniref:Uncharacterized protein n=1 Tax=Elysia marginata TaxID=1093978 RepID=A0AAV4J8M4_9GAST|nr:hypothetical protein ElyMa_005021600 [Elysia marginata]